MFKRAFTFLILFGLVLVLFSQDSPADSAIVKNDSVSFFNRFLSKEKDTVVNPYTYFDSLSYSRKAIYNIAFILPIDRNSIKKGDETKYAASLSNVSREALGFWEGVNIAFNNNIKNMKAKFNIHVWDNDMSDSMTKEILLQMDSMKKMDAIISPFHTRQALTVSRYCKERHIPMFLAQNSSDVPAKHNPFVFKFHIPKNRVFYDCYVKLVLDPNERNSDIFFVYDGLNKYERRVADYLKYMAEKDGSRRLKMLDYTPDLNIGSYLDTTRNSIYLISFYRTERVNEILSKLEKLTKYNVKVYGHNYWVSNPRIKKNLLDTLNARVYTDFYMDNNPTLFNSIKKDYTELTKDRAVTDVFLGYDVAMYVTTLLNDYGIKFPLSIDKFRYFGAATNVHMKPLYNGKGNILFFENQSKTLLRATREGWVKELEP